MAPLLKHGELWYIVVSTVLSLVTFLVVKDVLLFGARTVYIPA
jgi:hypothetical protein